MNSNTNPNQEQIKEIYFKEITTYVNEMKDNNSKLHNRVEIIEGVNKKIEELYGKEFVISNSAFYSYLRQLNFFRDSRTQYGFRDKITNLAKLISLKDYDNSLCYTVINEIYAPLICQKLNTYFQDYDFYLHCVHIQNLILCFFDSQKIEEEELKKLIPAFLKDFDVEDNGYNRPSYYKPQNKNKR